VTTFQGQAVVSSAVSMCWRLMHCLITVDAIRETISWPKLAESFAQPNLRTLLTKYASNTGKSRLWELVCIDKR